MNAHSGTRTPLFFSPRRVTVRNGLPPPEGPFGVPPSALPLYSPDSLVDAAAGTIAGTSAKAPARAARPDDESHVFFGLALVRSENIRRLQGRNRQKRHSTGVLGKGRGGGDTADGNAVQQLIGPLEVSAKLAWRLHDLEAALMLAKVSRIFVSYGDVARRIAEV